VESEDLMLQVGDRVRFRPRSISWALHRHAVGTVLRVFDLPANGTRVDVRWDVAGPDSAGLLDSALVLDLDAALAA
jgi:hypothetical protein